MRKLRDWRRREELLLDALRVHPPLRRRWGAEEGKPKETEHDRLDDQNEGYVAGKRTET
jgi:hypothetical protein